MIKESLAFIANHVWRESIKNLNFHLTESELKSFSSNDYYYLTTIHYMSKPNFSQLAETLKLTKPAISVIIRKLAGMGLIEKIQSKEDKRMFYICITTKGRNIIEGDEEIFKKIDLTIKNIVDTDEKYKFVEALLGKIVKSLETQTV
jgi:DNA-binding MarR family transcriptional regulator